MGGLTEHQTFGIPISGQLTGSLPKPGMTTNKKGYSCPHPELHKLTTKRGGELPTHTIPVNTQVPWGSYIQGTAIYGK